VGAIGLIASIEFLAYLIYLFIKLKEVSEKELCQSQGIPEISFQVDVKKKNGRSASQIPFIRQKSSVRDLKNPNQDEIETETQKGRINQSHKMKPMKELHTDSVFEEPEISQSDHPHFNLAQVKGVKI